MGESPSRTIAFTFVEPKTAVLVHSRDNPTNEEWRSYLTAMVGHMEARNGDLVSLIVTDGGGPNTVQRTDMNEMLVKGRSINTAVVTESRAARGIVTALGWFNAGIRAFSPARLDDALSYLGLDGTESGRVLETVDRLRAELDLAPLPARAGA